jgi:flagellar assembly protein FliH
MLSKIVDHDTAISRVNWRGVEKPAAALPAPARAGSSSPDELALLKARLAEVEAGAEDRIRDSYGTGLAEGEAAGRARAEEKVGEALERLAAAVAELAEARQRMLAQVEADLLKLSIEVARRILHRELTIDPNAVGALIKAAIDKLQGQMIYKVRVHPDHEAIVRSALQQFGTGSQIEIAGDPSRAPGSIVFELESGNLDASIDAQLREIERGLADNLERER